MNVFKCSLYLVLTLTPVLAIESVSYAQRGAARGAKAGAKPGEATKVEPGKTGVTTPVGTENALRGATEVSRSLETPKLENGVTAPRTYVGELPNAQRAGTSAEVSNAARRASESQEVRTEAVPTAEVSAARTLFGRVQSTWKSVLSTFPEMLTQAKEFVNFMSSLVKDTYSWALESPVEAENMLRDMEAARDLAKQLNISFSEAFMRIKGEQSKREEVRECMVSKGFGALAATF